MIYLIRTFGRAGRTALKVGYTGNRDKRLGTYRIENPFFEVISEREGDREVEKLLHLYLTALDVKENFLDEWFLDCAEVGSAFHHDLKRIERWVWRKREELFTTSDLDHPGSLKRTIYEKLKGMYGRKKKNDLDIYLERKKIQEQLKEMEKSTTFGGRSKRI